MDVLTYAQTAWRQDPDIQIEDAYKWLFHATCGGEHAITSIDGPKRWMEREWPTLTAPFPGEPLLVPLREDQKLVRLNLRPYRAIGGDKDRLLTAFVNSARQFHADKTGFKSAWQQLRDTLQAGSQGHLTVAEWQRLNRATAPDNYPAINHSESYEQKRHPAYRVLTRKEADALVIPLLNRRKRGG